jgi:hypothetical protein
MPTPYVVTASGAMDAPPERVYSIIADYHRGHPSILPKQFRNLTVEKGGVGAGTIIRFEVRAYGTTTRFRSLVSEPDPGRVLVEENVEPAPGKTTFTVVKSASGRGTTVTFRTEMTSRSGPFGALERFLSRRLLKKMYAEELSLLAARAEEPSLPGC